MTRNWLLTLMLLNAPSTFAQDLQLTPEPVTVRPNLIINPSFEQIERDILPGWEWNTRETLATLNLYSSDAATGERSIKLSNRSPFGIGTFGALEYKGGVQVKPGTVYTLSCRYKSFTEGAGFIACGQNQRARVTFKNSQGAWQRASITFATTSDEENLPLLIAVEAQTDALWVDDVKLEEGSSMSYFEPPSASEKPVFFWEHPSTFFVNSDEWSASVEIYTAQAVTGAILQAQWGDTRKELKTDLPAGLSRLRFSLPVGDNPQSTLTLTIVSPAKPPVLFQRALTLRTTNQAKEQLNTLKMTVPTLEEQLASRERRGEDTAYPKATLAIIKRFIPFIEQDLQKNMLERAFTQIDELFVLSEKVRLAMISKGALPSVPRYLTSTVEISGSSFIAETLNPATKQRERRPVFFTGFGHFGQVRYDLELFPQMGFNLIQVEMGPRDLFPAKDRVDKSALDQGILPLLKRAETANVAVNLLISPHYFPQWLIDEHPELKQRREGFIQFSPYAPAGQELLARYARFVAETLKSQPALHSLCLTNEPINVEDPESPLQKKEWRAWLLNKHKNLLNLNSRWNTNYQAWEEVPVPNEEQKRAFADWFTFNQEWFAGWHKRIADPIAEVNPIPVHAKLMTWNFFNGSEQAFGISAERFAEFCQINGNDAATYYSFDPAARWANDWVTTLMGHDLQRSVRKAPVFNSENHIIRDRETRTVPPEHVRNALWQAAIHGQSATTFWVWERTDDPKSDFAGSILHRPACVDALARTALDLNRLALEVSALQNAEPDFYLLYSPYSLVAQGEEFSEALQNLYIAAQMTGWKLGFVTERQLNNGLQLPLAKPLIISNAQYLLDETLTAIRQFQTKGGKVYGVGSANGQFDIYGRKRANGVAAEPLHKAARVFGPFLGEAMDNVFGRLPSMRRFLQLKTSENKPVWGVAFRAIPFGQGFIANLCNYTRAPITIRLRDAGDKPIKPKNLLDGEPQSDEITLPPLEPMLIYWE